MPLLRSIGEYIEYGSPRTLSSPKPTRPSTYAGRRPQRNEFAKSKSNTRPNTAAYYARRPGTCRVHISSVNHMSIHSVVLRPLMFYLLDCLLWASHYPSHHYSSRFLCYYYLSSGSSGYHSTALTSY